MEQMILLYDGNSKTVSSVTGNMANGAIRVSPAGLVKAVSDGATDRVFTLAAITDGGSKNAAMITGAIHSEKVTVLGRARRKISAPAVLFVPLIEKCEVKPGRVVCYADDGMAEVFMNKVHRFIPD